MDQNPEEEWECKNTKDFFFLLKIPDGQSETLVVVVDRSKKSLLFPYCVKM